MSIPDTVELAAEVVAAFVSSNPLPKSELPGLIQGVYSAIERLTQETDKPASSSCSTGASGARAQVDHG